MVEGVMSMLAKRLGGRLDLGAVAGISFTASGFWLRAENIFELELVRASVELSRFDPLLKTLVGANDI